MDTGSVIAVAGAQIVALSAIGVGLIQQSRSFTNERQLADRESVRTVLSEAAAIRHRLERAARSADATLANLETDFFASEESERPYRDLGEVIAEAEQLRGQMEIQLGPKHSATVAFDGVVDASIKIHTQLSMIRILIECGGLCAGDDLGTYHTAIDLQRKVFELHASEFVTRAHVAGGAELPAE